MVAPSPVTDDARAADDDARAAVTHAGSGTDAELLARYARRHDESAFAELVRRHVNMVHAAALRQTRGRGRGRDAHLADDVTQAVFIVLARRAGSVAIDCLPAWLLTTARLCAKDAIRRQIRREQHEQRAAAMRPTAQGNATDAGLEEVSIHLDHALCQLRPRDRTAVALRFLENRSMADVGQALGLSTNAAQKVLSRALEKLRRMLAGRGVMMSSTAALSAAMLESAAHAAPAEALGQIVAASLGGAGVVAGASASVASAGASGAGAAASHVIADGAIRATIAAAKLRVAVSVVAIAALVTGIAVSARAIMQSRRATPAVAAAPATAPNARMIAPDADVEPLHEYARPYPTLDPLVSKLIYEGRTDDLAALLDEAPWMLEARTPRQRGGFTPLLLAARAGDVDIINLLIRRGAYIEAENLWIGYTAINDAAYRGDPVIVKALLDAGAEVNHRARRGLTALGLYYYALDRGLGAVSPEEGARTEQMLIAAGSIYPQYRLKDRQEAAAARRAATAKPATAATAATTTTTTTAAATQPATAKVLGPALPNQRGPEPTPRANASDGVLPGGGNLAATVQANNARAVCTPPHTAVPSVRLFYIDRGFARPEDQELLVARFRILREPQTAAAMSVTPEQLHRLESMSPPPPGMLTSPADVSALQAQWSSYRAARKEEKPAAAAAMVKSLSRLAASAREPTRDAYAQRARQIQSILTPQQIATYREMTSEGT